MANDSRYLTDFNLCQECLEGNTEAITSLRDRFGNTIAAYLVHAGAAPYEATEIVDSLWADILVPVENQPPRLARYYGTSALQTWLNVVALNRLLSRKRVEQRWQQIIPARVGMPLPEHENDEARPWRVDPSVSSQQVDVVLIDLMRTAIETAFL